MLGGIVPCPCGRCLPCRHARRRLWSNRMFLESLVSKESCFVTLTYSNEKLPPGGTLDADHVQRFLKRLRKNLSPLKLRFFLVGEYGDRSERPHYHLILFGVGVLSAPLIEKAWRCPIDHTPYGYVDVKEANEATFQYVAGYCLKKMTSADDHRLNGRYPEFRRFSNRPGLGAAAVDVIISQLQEGPGYLEVEHAGDVPYRLMVGGKQLFLGRYIRRLLREKIGFTQEWIQGLKDGFSLESQSELRALLENSKHATTLKAAYQEAVKGKIASLKSRSSVFGSRREL